MENEKVIVNTRTCHIYNFVDETKTTCEEALQEAIEATNKQIRRWTEICKDQPENEQFQKYLEEYKTTTFEIMTWDEFLKRQRDHLLSDEPTEITEEDYNDALNVLPPLKWCTKKGVEMFCMCEMYTGSYTTQYARYCGRYYCKMVDCKDESTWLHNILVK